MRATLYFLTMKRNGLITLVSATLLMIQAPADAAAPKAGAPCSKANQSQISNGVKYTCSKSGKKLLWKKVTKSSRPTMTPEPTASPSPTPTPSPTPAGYTMEQVRANNTAAKCWSVIDSKVYDLTNWINSHPGGSGAIKSLCGIDGTSAFRGQHGGSGSPASRLAGYLLGPLAK